MSNLDTEFAAAFDESNRLPKKPGQLDLLKLYAYYKQGSVGDVQGEQPSMLQLTARLKYDTWAGLKGMTKTTAQQTYIELVKSLQQSLAN